MDVLVGIAESCGLDAAETRAHLLEPKWKEQVCTHGIVVHTLWSRVRLNCASIHATALCGVNSCTYSIGFVLLVWLWIQFLLGYCGCIMGFKVLMFLSDDCKSSCGSQGEGNHGRAAL